jgi:hypothetical protein
VAEEIDNIPKKKLPSKIRNKEQNENFQMSKLANPIALRVGCGHNHI